MLTVEIRRDTPDRSIQWKTIGYILHRHRSPVYTGWSDNGKKWYEEYRVNDKLSRDPLKGPAYTYWHINGQKYYEEYWVNGERHRDPTLGPAYTSWHNCGQKCSEEYWVNGKQVKLEDYHAGR